MSRAKDLELRLERAEAQMRLYQKISRYLVKPVPLPDALHAVVELVASFTQADSCLLYFISHGELVLCAAHGPNPAAVGEVKLRLHEGLTGWVARERRMLAISREAYADPRFKYFSNLPEDSFEAFLSAPVLVKNRVIGVVNLQHRQPYSHTGDDMEMITTAGQQLGALMAIACVEQANLDSHDFAELAIGPRVAVPEH